MVAAPESDAPPATAPRSPPARHAPARLRPAARWTIDFDADPVLRLRREQIGLRAVPRRDRRRRRAPSRHAEAAASEDEALGVLEEARQGRLPTVDLSVTSYRVLSREFSNDPFNIIERSRPRQRTDAMFSVNQTLFDFGATTQRILAAGARLRGRRRRNRGRRRPGRAERDRRLVRRLRLPRAGRADRGLRRQPARPARRGRGTDPRGRVGRGRPAPGRFLHRPGRDPARPLPPPARQRRGALHRADRHRRRPPVSSARRPAGPARRSRDDGRRSRPARHRRRAQRPGVADASRREARAARADRLPSVTAGIDAGRYGVIENDRDYDIRGRVALRYRIFGGADARAEQAGRAPAPPTPAPAASARRPSATPPSPGRDVRALEEQLEALEAAYIASRRSRDVIVERFRVARGTLFDVVAAEDSLFRKRHRLHPGAVGTGRRPLRAAIAHGPAARALEIDPDRLRGEG